MLRLCRLLLLGLVSTALCMLTTKRCPNKSSQCSVRHFNAEQRSVALKAIQGEAQHTPRHNSQVVVVLESESSPSYFTTKPVGTAVAWNEVFEHLQLKLSWEAPNNRFDASLGDLGFSILTLGGRGQDVCVGAPVLLLVGLKSKEHLAAVRELSNNKTTVVALDCAEEYQQLETYGGGSFVPRFDAASPTNNFALAVNWAQSLFDGGSKLQNRRTYETVQEVKGRRSTDDILFLLLVLINEYYPPFQGQLSSVVSATSSEKTGLGELGCMCSKCGKQMASCLTDPTCKKALDCLNKCKSNDQVCAYRCITSYETDRFQDFAFCILQRNNCMGNKATIPSTPDPAPLSSFRGAPLTHEVAEGIFEGWLRPREGEENALLPASADLVPQSWMVVCGVNPAYDYFSDQHQIFYRERARRSIMWYDPVFKVETLDGQQVWRRRHYRVRRGEVPGQFRFTVIDNGVLSDEYWRILDCDDDLGWAVFYYGGAAAAAGTSYTGALIVTRSGAWPEGMDDVNSDTHRRVAAALARGGIKLYEVYPVGSTLSSPGLNLAGPPPLGIL